MSKFSVLVVGHDNYNNLQEVLEPYREHSDFPPYIKYTRKEKAVEKKKLLKHLRQQLQLNPYDIGIFNKVAELEEMDIEQYFLNSTKYCCALDLNENGEPISTYNPNSRWLYWIYDHLLCIRPKHMKKEIFACALKKKNVDWQYMSDVNYQQAQVNWIGMFDSSIGGPKPSEKLANDYWEGETKEQYIERKRMFLTHAYILHGKWYERGKIGWWQKDSNIIDRDKWLAQYEKMLTQVKPNTMLTTIECTI